MEEDLTEKDKNCDKSSLCEKNEGTSSSVKFAAHYQAMDTDEEMRELTYTIAVTTLEVKDDDDRNPSSPCVQFWCQRCCKTREKSCPVHGTPTFVVDKPILSKALASLPSGLIVTDIAGTDCKGVTSKKILAANSIFGPFDAEEVEQKPEEGLLILVEKDGKRLYLNYTDEHSCNWMMHVRPAQNGSEINMMLFELSGKIYFVTSKSVACQQELRVAYSPPYANKYGLRVITSESQPFKCEACGLTFQSNIAKVGHCRNLKCKTMARKTNKVKKEKSHADDNPKNSKVKDSKTKYRRKKPTLIPRMRLVCPECTIVFGHQQLMDIHMLSHDQVSDPSADDYIKDSEYEALDQGPRECEAVDQGPRECGAVDQGPRECEVQDQGPRTCPACLIDFDAPSALFEHIICEHSQRSRKSAINLNTYETMEKDMVVDVESSRGPPNDIETVFKDHLTLNSAGHVYGSEASKLKCKECGITVESVPALSAHTRSHHVKKNYFGCFLCEETFPSSKFVYAHVTTHAIDGLYHCPKCPNKIYDNWKKCRKHVQAVHSGKEFPCDECAKVFSRSEKLKLHMLTHTNVREFMCDTCGRQFARKDKLLEHIRKLHQVDADNSDITSKEVKQSKPKLHSTDYYKYLYKCNECGVGFKRRGMLINHFVKVHPSLPLSSVAELNLPILRTNIQFHCMYCNRIYKSSTKRRIHIETKHPGLFIPPPIKRKDMHNQLAYAHTIENTTSYPYACEHCHKQYTEKYKLTEHKKLKHPHHIAAARNEKILETNITEHILSAQLASNQDVVTLLQPLDNAEESVALSLQAINLDAARVDNSDLLTQAMSVNELQPSLDFQTQNQQLTANATVTMPNGSLELRILSNPSLGIDLNSLQMTDINNSGITFAVPSTSIGLAQPMQQNIISSRHITPNLNSTASQNSPRASWSYQFKLN